jgi:hypothetical protein
VPAPTPSDAAIAFERRAETVVTLRFSAKLQRVALSILQSYAMLSARAGGQPSADAVIGLRRTLRERLEKIEPGMGAALDDMIENGIAFGVRASGGREPELPTRAAGDLVLEREPDRIDRRATEALRQTVASLATMPFETHADAVAMSARVLLPARRAEAQVRWAANRAINAGTASVARSFGETLVWVPERNACLRCLSYAGAVAWPGQNFAPIARYGTKPAAPPGDLPYPPLHPNCRCQIRRYGGPSASTDPSARDMASALAREARRSVARGFSGFDSLPERQRAAGALLRQGAGLAPTVVARARADVARGTFSTRHRRFGLTPVR